MASIGCLLGSLSFCVCPSGQICHSLSQTSAGSVWIPQMWNSGVKSCNLRFGNCKACFTGKNLISSGKNLKSAAKLYNPTWIRTGTVRERTANSTFYAEATDRKSRDQSVAESTDQSVTESSVQSHLDLLERFTSETSTNNGGRTIAEQLEIQVGLGDEEEVTVPLAQNVTLETAPLTIHQKRNIRRQKYLDEVAKRNDTGFFTTVALIIILPPSVILGVAVATGYVQLFP